ncbi:hypothetical protein [Arthrobacter sp. FW306-2-2C-D06B]|uniref:hypothetical protein n=1 Tax=Arthrobacter sp. FW306-2-2C-D06B TaxID=2879618 RepID=UPI001F40A42F|nr:hypothetical protein [Arthrobacter sp. FW306-2-2C-D06B]UKA60518.1 hypothetical protein LFT47_09400 [Arthrobacter sp. FW306-2-2C-D06B]
MLGKSHIKGHADVVDVQVVETQAFLRPEAEGVADETEDIDRVFIVRVSRSFSFSHGRRWPWQLGSCIVLIRGPLLGMRGRSATWGTGNNPKIREEISDEGAPTEVLDWVRRVAAWLRAGPAQQ